MSEISYYTEEGLSNLKNEIKNLESIERPKIFVGIYGLSRETLTIHIPVFHSTVNVVLATMPP